MTAFKVKGTYYKLTLYIDAWNKEIVDYGFSTITSYFDGLKQVLNKIKDQTDLVILHTNQGSVYASKSYK